MNIKKCLENTIENYKKMNCHRIYLLLILLCFNYADDAKDQESLYRRAKSFEQTGLIDEAEQLYFQIFRSSPKNLKYYNALKKILIKKDDCPALIDNTDLLCDQMNNKKTALLNKLETYILCDLDWLPIYNNLKNTNIRDLIFLKKIVSILLNNKQEDIAIQLVDEIREKNKNYSFFAMELGYYYLSLNDYSNSLKEYLSHLEKHPNHFPLINQRVMMFPDDIEITDSIIPILQKSTMIKSKIILSDIYFKLGDYLKSIEILKTNNLYEELLSVAIDIDSSQDYDTSHKLYLYIIENANTILSQKAVYEFAKSLEKRSIAQKTDFAISSIMNNEFFSSPFIRINEDDSKYLYEAISLYDSLGIKNNDLKSMLRLSDIRFKVLGDLDNAYKLYTKIYNLTKDNDIKLQSTHRIIDVLNAQGKLDNSFDFVNSALEASNWTPKQKNKIEIKKNQILFYQSDIDEVFENLSQITKALSIQDNEYNDILEVMNSILILKNNSDFIEDYSKAQLKINQNKRTEAINILNNLVQESDDILFNNMVNFQIANLLIYQSKTNEAIIKLDSIKGNHLYEELSLLLIAEIYDYIINDTQKAKTYYLSMLQKFPDSIYYEDVRLRLVKIMDKNL